ncbi:spore germination protein [Paenibacillus sp. NPDC058071]|uniref:spore germination protein n=1 Tax=Paenibacillus sp. NPDC058071 TaxID=3346326 RepID=UPI0036DE64E5
MKKTAAWKVESSKLYRIISELEKSDDIVMMDLGTEETRRLFRVIFCSGLVDMQTASLTLLPDLDKLGKWLDKRGGEEAKEESTWTSGMLGSKLRLESEEGENTLYTALFSGGVIVIEAETGLLFQFDMSNIPGRQPEESVMELSLKGPRDGFVERLGVNIALIRHRLRSPKLRCEIWQIGEESRTEVAVMYMSGVASQSLIEEARRRLKAIRIDVLHGASQLEDLLSDRPRSLFPLVEYIGRPDYTVKALIKGKIVFLPDGSPTAIIAPANLLLLIKSPEDLHLPYYFVSLERLLRIVGFVIALCMPGFWVSLSAYNTDQIPYSLLATVSISRIGLPLSATMEMFLMLTMFELFREAGVRLPRAVGQTVTVVGGLIVGDAAIRAGLTSPTMLVAAAVTAVGTFTLVNQSLVGTVSLLRYFVLILSSLFGIFGFFVSVFAILIYICSLESFGMPYMAPIGPLRWRELIPALVKQPWKRKDKGD